jgi:predicted translin family RNA/ssDNA-binding protein
MSRGFDIGTKQEILEKAKQEVIPIRQNIHKVAQELEGQEYMRFLKAFSPGLQEYIEAVSLMEFLENGTLLSREKTEKDIDGPIPFPITTEDWMGGIADL